MAATTQKVLLFLFLGTFFSCNIKDGSKLESNLPKAKGKSGSIIVVMDSTLWTGEVGKAVKSVFQDLEEGLPREEPLFTLSQIPPSNFESLFKTQKNIIFVTVLNDNSPGSRRLKKFFTQESIDMINKDSTLFMFEKKNEFAQGQEILHLFGKTQSDLINNLEKNKETLQKHFLDIEHDRINKALFSAKPEKGISNHIKDKFGCEMKIPYGYEIAVEGDKFLWLRSFSIDIDKNIFISYVDYTSEEQFSLDSLIKIREEVSRPYILYKPEEPESYMLTETKNFDVSRKEVNFNGNYAVQLKGLWFLNKFSMGGPFVSYAMVDESKNRLYYIEGFLYSPADPQRDSMRELDVILNTFKIPS